ncbi:MAG: iron export ABC transporter permease subunit FetB [Candidatus Marinimicrobia bacterium]|nr:iron export ABC transporter permease subunit FetB [Candidatus Neomarinimicrobiota bacterium]
MTQSFYAITWTDVLVSLIFVAISIGLIRWWKIGIEKTLLIGTFRTFIQLSAMGYILTYFFQQHHWSFMVGLVSLMIVIASHEGYRRLKKYNIPNIFWILLGSFFFTVFIVLGLILNLILSVEPWFYPYAMIPIAGMIIGNALNSTTLTVNRFVSEITHRENEIEMLLSLGAPVKAAVHDSFKESVKAALLPNINALMTVGLVQLPGVMTGQILAGIDPLVAIRYQIMIMYMWISTATMVDILVLNLVYRQFFTPQMQLKRELLRTV